MASEGMVEGLAITNRSESASICSGCAYGNLHRQPFPGDGRTRAKRVGELHSDVCGPMSVLSPGGAMYFVIFKDEFSGF